MISAIKLEGIICSMHVRRSEFRFENETIVRERWYQVIILLVESEGLEGSICGYSGEERNARSFVSS